MRAMRLTGLMGLMLVVGQVKAATVVYHAERFTGTVNNRQVTIKLRTDGLLINSNFVFGTPLVMQPSAGVATTNLLPGGYLLQIDQVPTQFPFDVPDSTNTYQLFDLVNRNIYVLASGTGTNFSLEAGDGIAINTNGPLLRVSATGNASATNVIWPVAGTNTTARTNALTVAVDLAASPTLAGKLVVNGTTNTEYGTTSIEARNGTVVASSLHTTSGQTVDSNGFNAGNTGSIAIGDGTPFQADFNGNVQWSGTATGDINGGTNGSPALATNNATATDGMVLSKTGNKLKLVAAGSGSQTPWTGDINAGEHSLTAAGNIAASNFVARAGGQFTGNLAGGTNLPHVAVNWFTNSVYFVDVTNGNNSTAVKGRPDFPWQSLQTAQTVMSSGDVCVVADGTYTTGIWKVGCAFELGRGVSISVTTPALAVGATNGTMFVTGGMSVQGDYFQTNADVTFVNAGALLFNVDQNHGLSAAGSANYATWGCSLLYFLIDETTNLNLAVNCDSVLNFGQLYPGAHVNAKIMCRAFLIDSGFGGVLDANSDANSRIDVLADTFDVDFASAFQFQGSVSKLWNIHANLYRLANVPTVGASLTLNGGVLTTAMNSGMVSNTILNGVTIDTSTTLPNEPRSKYYDVIGL
jgi:hypothetical protein